MMVEVPAKSLWVKIGDSLLDLNKVVTIQFTKGAYPNSDKGGVYINSNIEIEVLANDLPQIKEKLETLLLK